MKENKKVILIVSVTLVVLFVMGFFMLKRYKHIEEPVVWGVTNKRSYDYEDITYRVNDYFIVTKDDKYGIIDIDGNVIRDVIYESIMIDELTNTYTMEVQGVIYYVNDLNEIVFHTKDDIQLVYTHDNSMYYYSEEKDGKTILYDKTGKELSTIDLIDSYIIYNDYIFSSNKGINIFTKDTFKYNSKFMFESDNYYIFNVDKKYRLYDVKNDKFTYYDKMEISDNGVRLSNNSDVIILDNYGNVIQDYYKNIINDKIYLEYSKCRNGFNVYLDNKKIDDICYDTYSVSEDNNAIIVNDASSYKAILSNGDVVNSRKPYVIVGNYVIDYDSNLLYKSDGDKRNNTCVEYITYNSDNTYVCSDYINYSIYDGDFNKISDDYDNIYCSINDTCIVVKDNRYGLFSKGEEIVSPIYYDGHIIDDEYVVFNKLFGTDVLEIGLSFKPILKDNIKLEGNKVYSNIDVDKVINEYYLFGDINEIIHDNEELFQQYAYIVLNNENVNGYRKELFMIFKIIVDNRDDLDIYKLFNSLKDLSITKLKEISLDGAAGVYYDYDKRIELLTNKGEVVYHELIHFLDFNFNDTGLGNICLYNGNYYVGESFKRLTLDERNKCDMQYVTLDNYLVIEGAAEYYTGYYMRDYRNYSYTKGVLTWGALNYILGDQFGKDIYFGENGKELFVEEMLRYMSFLEYGDFILALREIIPSDGNHSDSNVSIVIDRLIDIYKVVKGPNWYLDNEFMFILNNIKGNNTLVNPIKDEDRIKINEDFGNIHKILNTIKKDVYAKSLPTGYIHDNDKSYITLFVYDGIGEDALNREMIIEYDFKNKKVNNYQFYLVE